jgi:DNA/RNA endonuclease YhcR with UshA esterase domain
MKKLSFFLLSAFFLFSCVKQEFDAPPAEGNTSGLTANKTIKDLKAFHKLGAFETITEDWIIEGTVVADDQSGNYYKSIVIQDATAGIDVRLDANSLYNDYPEGRKINIKCKDLVISDYNGLTQLGGGVFKNASGQDQLGGIAQLLLPNYIVKGARDQKVTPKEVKIGELTDAETSTLVTLKNVQFDDKSMDLVYAASKVTTNRTIVDCDGIAITLRTSGYSTFANEKTPSGKGTITGIYSVFGTTKQFYIRDVTDVKLTETVRCNGTTGGGGTGGGPITGTLVPIGDLRAAFAAGKLTVAASTKITGTVISDKAGKNIAAASAVVQGNDGKGIIVRFSGTHNFAVGETIDVNTSGATLSEFNGALQVAVGATTNAAKTGTGAVTPKKVTLAQFEADFKNMESTLITIADAKASTTAKFAGSINLTDASNGKAVMYTATAATFGADVLPSDVVNVTGIVSSFNATKQIQPRNAADVTKGTGGGGGTGGGTATQKSIAEVRAVFTGTKTTCPATTFIKGIVISDKDTKNINVQNLILQEPNGKGILVRFSAAHSFALGDEIEVIVSGVELSEYNALLQVNGVPLANGKKTGTGNVTVKELTINELNDNFENYESTLVVIKNATIPAAAKYAGAIKINDGTGEIDLFTATGATFSAAVPPVGAKTITAIVSQFKSATATTNGYQIQIRNEGDIK